MRTIFHWNGNSAEHFLHDSANNLFWILTTSGKAGEAGKTCFLHV